MSKPADSTEDKLDGTKKQSTLQMVSSSFSLSICANVFGEGLNNADDFKGGKKESEDQT